MDPYEIFYEGGEWVVELDGGRVFSAPTRQAAMTWIYNHEEPDCDL
jgi:hypothetical protein